MDDRGRRRRGARLLSAMMPMPSSVVMLSVVMLSVVMLSVVVIAAPTVAAAPPTWSVTPSPNQPHAENVLTGVSCVGPSFCFAAGEYSPFRREVSRTEIEQWDGKTWSIVASPNPAKTFDLLWDVSCVSATSCVAVGNSSEENSSFQTLIETWDGKSWSVTPSPSPKPNRFAMLSAVTCPSPTRCVAVGSTFDHVTRTLIETWDGKRWSVTPSPSPGTASSQLAAVSCPGSTSCVAVGSSSTPTRARPLIETWDGKSWSVTPSPTQGSEAGLSAVSCAGSTSCLAVGARQRAGVGGIGALVEKWDGTAWSRVTPPDPGSQTELAGVSCVSATSCAAVGDVTADDDETFQTVIETWDGTSLSVVPSPSPGFLYNFPASVTCVRATRCVAVGADSTDGGDTLVLTGPAVR